MLWLACFWSAHDFILVSEYPMAFSLLEAPSMREGSFVLTQLMQQVPRRTFDQCVRRYQGNRRVRTFTCRDQFLCMAFAQLTFRDSLRELVLCLRAMGAKLYHVGLRGGVRRSTLADANERRDWRIWADFARVLIDQARRLYVDDDFGVHLSRTAYVLDATVIDLCLSLFPWAHAQRECGGLKVHTLLDLRGNIPCFMRISSTRATDASTLDHLVVEPGAYYVMDRAYNDFARLFQLHRQRAVFVVRAKNNLTVRRCVSRPVDRSTGVRSDQIVRLAHRQTASRYPDPLRRVSYFDVDRRRRLVFMTNDLDLPAKSIADLYRCRWQIELFFKWIKQHLRIRHFFGTSSNAVKTQLWIAISVYTQIAILRKQLAIKRSLAEMLQILSLSLFEKTPLNMLFSHDLDTPSPTLDPKQLTLFNL
jgi:hypothetical protein